jgi:hypothetical protein
MKIKKEALEKAINTSLKDLRNGCESEAFCIYAEDGIEVQVHITTDENDFLDCILEDYERAAE